MKSYSLVRIYRPFGVKCSLHIQARIGYAGSPVSMIYVYQNTRRHIPEISTIHSLRPENVKSFILSAFRLMDDAT
jgi:hypothetical protein